MEILYNDPVEIYNQIFSLLETGVKDRNSPYHTPTLVTLENNNIPAARTLVLRGVDRETRTLRFHTDQRSKKIEQINFNPSGAIHIYSQQDKLQLRFKSNLTLHINGELVDEAWEKSYGMSKICYQVGEKPGSVIKSQDEYKYIPMENHEGKDNFLVILARITEIEWLYLSCEGHRRAKFTHDKNNQLNVSWLVP